MNEGFANLTYLLLTHDGKGRQDKGFPYYVDIEGNVVSSRGGIAYEADSITEQEAEFITALYNRFGGDHAWLFIQPIMALYLEGEKNHRLAGGE